MAPAAAKGALQLATDNPTQFFTNVAARLLATDCHLSLGQIQLYPTNQYTPAVHRVLQLSANLFDATTADPFPSLFHPVFRVSNHTVQIGGYRYQTNSSFFTNPKHWFDMATVASAPDGDYSDILITGVPVVVGAKKGFPNFNEFAMQSLVLVSRKLELRKANLGGPVTETNQVYLIGITNVFGVELWNAYSTTYPRPLEVRVKVDTTSVLVNENGAVSTNAFQATTVSNFPANSWTGYPGFGSHSPSVKVPLAGGFQAVSNSTYWQSAAGGGYLTNLTAGFQSQASVGFPLPQWFLTTTNRLRLWLVDTDASRIVDLVNLDGLGSVMDVSEVMNGSQSASTGIEAVWRTNRAGSGGVSSPTQGILWQLAVGLGNSDSTVDWRSYAVDAPSGQAKQKAIDAFRVFFGFSPMYGTDTSWVWTSIAMQCPFSPARRFYVLNSWQANDPLVHFTASDITDLLRTNDIAFLRPPGTISTSVLIPNIGRVNTQYRPWPAEWPFGTDPLAFNLALKDPLVRRADEWSFPTNQALGVRWLGRLHRGTPWQTVNLKSAVASTQNWALWTGNADSEDAQHSHPTNDWRLASLLVSLLNTNDPHHLLSVNNPNPGAWRAALDGMTVLTNTLADGQITNLFQPGQFSDWVMRSNSTQASVIEQAVNTSRAALTNPHFGSVGELLAVPELSVNSPWLNLSSTQQQFGLSDEAYEAIPAQLLPLMRPDSVGLLTWTDGLAHVQFTGFDGYPYGVEVSSNLQAWTTASTNWPTNGVFSLDIPIGDNQPHRFWRSALLP